MFGLFKNDPPKERSLSEGFGVLGTLSLLLGVFADASADSASEKSECGRGVSFQDGRDPYTREWAAAETFGTEMHAKWLEGE